MSGPLLVVFTDLDGTLLDAQTYSPAAAREALQAIEQRQVPLVFCTSKTRAEVEALRRKLKNKHPFIVENGGGIFIPRGYFQIPPRGASPVGRYHRIALARPYHEITKLLDEITRESGVKVIGFHQMTTREVARVAALSLEEARRARAREFDEPFFFTRASKRAKERFAERVNLRGLQLARGDRFWHLFSGSDKGRATRELAGIYRASWRHALRTVALGNSANDLPMLAAADFAVALPGHDGKLSATALARLPGICRGEAPGPEGWNRAVLQIIGRPTTSRPGTPRR